MSHELDFTLGRAAIAYAGDVPWHGHGNPILPTDTLDEIRIKAGLAYDVIGRPIHATVEHENNGFVLHENLVIPNKQSLWREDTNDFLSIVGKDYKIVQPAKILEFFKDLLAKYDITVDVAGALDDGRKVWALGKLGDDFTLHGRDTLVPYVLVVTSYDGSLSTTAMLVTIRVVCNNTLRFSGAFTADGDHADVFKVRHNQDFNITEAHGKLGLDEDAWNAHKTRLEQLARFQVSPEEVLEFFFNVAGQGDKIVRNEDNNNIISFPQPGRVVKQFINGYKNGPGSDLTTANGTLFGALNAVTFYQDHLAPASNRGQRFSSATFGGGNVRKQHALDLCLAKLEAA